MGIRIRIESLRLEGIPLPATHRRRLQAAVQRELARLVAERGLPARWATPGAVPKLPAGPIRPAPGEAPEALGRKIAASVYGGVAGHG